MPTKLFPEVLIVGMHFRGEEAKAIVANFVPPLALRLEREPLNPYDSFAIKSEAQPVLEAHARFLRADRNRRVNLEGHTDERGGREYNLALGQKRAEAVRRALTALGVSDAQMEAVSFGKEKPSDTGSSESAYAKNRRVELTYR